MKLKYLPMMILTTLALPTYAITIPSSDQPGAVIPKLSRPFLTQIPKANVTVEDQTLTPQSQTSQQKKSRAPRFVVKRVEVLGFDKHSTLDTLKLNQIARALRLKLSDHSGKISVPELHQIAHQLTVYIRKQGYLLARVYLPPQKLNDERLVRYQLRPGDIGQISVQGNRVYTQSQLLSPFKRLIGKPFEKKSFESALVTLTQYPGLKVKALIQPGKKPGQTHIILKVLSSHRINFTLSGDNFGTQTTGRYRSTAEVSFYNLTHGADNLTLSYLQKFTPSNTNYYQIAYSRQLFSPNTRLLTSYSYNDYSLGHDLEGQGLGGESQIEKLALSENLITNRNVNSSIQAGLTHYSGFLKQNANLLNRDKLTVANLSYRLSGNWKALRVFSALALQYDHGFNNFLDSMGNAPDGGIYPARQGGSGQYAQGKFNKESLNIFIYQAPFAYQLLEFTLSGQFSDDLLTSFSQMGFGGATQFSAYSSNEYLADKGFQTQLSWLFPIPGLTHREFFSTGYRWGNLLHVGPKVEYGMGWNNDASRDDVRHFALADYGLELQFEIGHHFQLEASGSKPFGSSPLPHDSETERYWAGLTYSYNGF